jgi:hypothetical protein
MTATETDPASSGSKRRWYVPVVGSNPVRSSRSSVSGSFNEITVHPTV